ncbi:uncharacterized protein LOC123261597 [Cotesia glomerata]|uniref:40S ribosomal protein S19-binding protein 1 n=1 Tax=Cotesia glomerata TaxID=32391 RepID=A0AAV7IAV4_COTGL|nr:uncharacterized protein LOC123261597 [Cotesia glomerata]KAH0549385.1 hypothetical protein KQX54_008845 [Cotesia glomerata]
MSNSLVRASLEIINIGDNVKLDKKKKKKTNDILGLIPANHRVNKKNKKDSSVFTHNRKVTINEARKKLADKKDLTEENIEKLLHLSSFSVNTEVITKLIERAVSKRAVVEKEKPKEEEATAFTEEDFAKFEEEFML